MPVEAEAFSLAFGRWDDQRNERSDQLTPWEATPRYLVVLHSGPDHEPGQVGDPMEGLIARWVRLACAHARTRPVSRKSWVADIVAVPGAWFEAPTNKAALAGLPSVVEEWVRMKLEDGDADIPRMEGLKLIIDE
jgi:hypothetical protein